MLTPLQQNFTELKYPLLLWICLYIISYWMIRFVKTLIGSQRSLPHETMTDKSSAVAEMGHHARAKWVKKWAEGLLCPFWWGSWVPI